MKIFSLLKPQNFCLRPLVTRDTHPVSLIFGLCDTWPNEVIMHVQYSDILHIPPHPKTYLFLLYDIYRVYIIIFGAWNVLENIQELI